MKYAIIENPENHPGEREHFGSVYKFYATRRDAWRAYDKVQAECRRANGSNTWLNLMIIEIRCTFEFRGAYSARGNPVTERLARHDRRG